MSKIRTLPFGYKMVDGEIIADFVESKTVCEIFEHYAKGKSYKWIAENTTVPYSENVAKWGKNNVLRVLENEKYTGEKGFPIIINYALFDKVQSIRKSKGANYNVDNNRKTLALRGIGICEVCNSQLKHTRIRTGRNTVISKWCCSNNECDNKSVFTDDDIFQAINEVLEKIRQVPEIIDNVDGAIVPTSMEITKLENRIERTLENTDFDYFKVKDELLELASQKYNACNYPARHLTEKIKSMLSETDTTALMNGIFQNILLSREKIKIKLLNGKILALA